MKQLIVLVFVLLCISANIKSADFLTNISLLSGKTKSVNFLDCNTFRYENGDDPIGGLGFGMSCINGVVNTSDATILVVTGASAPHEFPYKTGSSCGVYTGVYGATGTVANQGCYIRASTGLDAQNLISTNGFSISFWIKFNYGTSPNVWGGIGVVGTTTVARGSSLVLFFYDNGSAVRIATYGTAYTASGYYTVADRTVIRDNEWHHIVVTLYKPDAETNINSYVDGSLTYNYDNVMSGQSTTVTGAYLFAGVYFNDPSLSNTASTTPPTHYKHMAIYNTELSSTQVSNLYTAQAPVDSIDVPYGNTTELTYFNTNDELIVLGKVSDDLGFGYLTATNNEQLYPRSLSDEVIFQSTGRKLHMDTKIHYIRGNLNLGGETYNESVFR